MTAPAVEHTDHPPDRKTQYPEAAEQCGESRLLSSEPLGEVVVRAERKGADIEDQGTVADAEVLALGGKYTALLPKYSLSLHR